MVGPDSHPGLPISHTRSKSAPVPYSKVIDLKKNMMEGKRKRRLKSEGGGLNKGEINTKSSTWIS